MELENYHDVDYEVMFRIVFASRDGKKARYSILDVDSYQEPLMQCLPVGFWKTIECINICRDHLNKNKIPESRDAFLLSLLTQLEIMVYCGNRGARTTWQTIIPHRTSVEKLLWHLISNVSKSRKYWEKADLRDLGMCCELYVVSSYYIYRNIYGNDFYEQFEDLIERKLMQGYSDYVY